MSRTLSTKNQGEVTKVVTTPVFLVELNFASPLRFSTRGTIAVTGGNTFSAAGISVNLDGKSVRLFNAAFAYTATFLAGVAGVVVKVWKVYGAGPIALADLDMVFHGQIGAVPELGEYIVFGLRDFPPFETPRVRIAPPTFNNLPPRGTEIVTPTGIYQP